MKCAHCGKVRIVTIELEAAPQVRQGNGTDPHLRSQLAEEGKGASAGSLTLCVRCWRDGCPVKAVAA